MGGSRCSNPAGDPPPRRLQTRGTPARCTRPAQRYSCAPGQSAALASHPPTNPGARLQLTPGAYRLLVCPSCKARPPSLPAQHHLLGPPRRGPPCVLRGRAGRILAAPPAAVDTSRPHKPACRLPEPCNALHPRQRPVPCLAVGVKPKAGMTLPLSGIALRRLLSTKATASTSCSIAPDSTMPAIYSTHPRS